MLFFTANEYSVHAENQPAAESSGQHEDASSIMATLEQVNQAARKAAEGSAGTWSNPNIPQGVADDVNNEAAEMQVCPSSHLAFLSCSLPPVPFPLLPDR
jgi:hypothetical protein